MKIPLILIKSKTHIDSDLYDMRVNGDWHEFSKQDLKDLRSLIDTVLKEERKIGGHTYSKSGKDMCCQPLTEGEKCECKEMSCKDGCDRKHTCKTFWCEKCKPQESNKEGEPLQKAFTRGNSCLYYQRRIRRSWWIETKRPR